MVTQLSLLWLPTHHPLWQQLLSALSLLLSPTVGTVSSLTFRLLQ